jgi:hypothetical protein
VTRLEAVSALFIAFGADRKTDQAKLYVTELEREISCGDCAELAATTLMRTAKRLPSLADLLQEARDVMNSGAHVSHVVSPQLAPKAETWWRHDAVKLILPHVAGDRDLAAFIAAQMWWSAIPRDAERIDFELRVYPMIWIASARVFVAGKELPALVDVAFRRARWASEHANDEEIPSELLNLVTAEASA